MKKSKIILIIGLITIVLLLSSHATTAYQKKDNSSEETFRDTIEFEGTCEIFFHIGYKQIPWFYDEENMFRIKMATLFFNHANVSINNDEICRDGKGLMFLFNYRGQYDLDYEQKSLTMNGNALYIKTAIIKS